MPCRYCKGFYHHKLLWSHAKSCPCRSDCNETDTKTNIVKEARCLLAHCFPKEDEETACLNEIIDKMRETKDNPGLKELCYEDELIREYGLYELGRLGTPEEQRSKDQNNISNKMRTLARLLKKLNSDSLFPQPLSNYICAQKFKNVVSAVKELHEETGSSQLVLCLGNILKQVSLMKVGIGLQTSDLRKREEAKEFTEMFSAQWKGKVSGVANRSKGLKALNKRCEIPATEDLVSLKNCLVEEIKIKTNNMVPNYAEYVYMTHLLIARIVLFNKR